MMWHLNMVLQGIHALFLDLRSVLRGSAGYFPYSDFSFRLLLSVQVKTLWNQVPLQGAISTSQISLRWKSILALWQIF